MGAVKAKLVPVKFAEINEREQEEFEEQLAVLAEMYRDTADFLKPVVLGEALPEEADLILFPQLIFCGISS